MKYYLSITVEFDEICENLILMKVILISYLVHSRERGLGNILVVDLPHLCHVGEAVGAYGAEVVAGADKLVEAGLADEKKLSMYLKIT